MRTNTTAPDESGHFTHVLTSAAATSAPAGLGANSVFALGGKPTDSKPQRKVRASPQRERLIKTLEACGELNTDGISEAMGITVQAAADLAWKAAKAELIAYAERDGRKFYRVRSHSAVGFQSWLEKKATHQEESAAKDDAKRLKKGRLAIKKELTHGTETPGSATPIRQIRVTANAIQHGGQHYKALPIEPWDYIAANGIGFLEGNAIKYLTRWKEKGGVEDLHKASHYVQKLIEINTQGSSQ